MVPLPLPQSDYLADFASAESKAEFLRLLGKADEVIELPPVPTRDEAYEAAGNYVLEHCDVLIAIWDGPDAQGQGGTGASSHGPGSVACRLRGSMLATATPGTQEPTSLGAEQGTVTFERDSHTRTPSGPASADGLTKALEELQQAFVKWDGSAVHRQARRRVSASSPPCWARSPCCCSQCKSSPSPYQCNRHHVDWARAGCSPLRTDRRVSPLRSVTRPPGYATACAPRSCDGSAT